MKSALYSLILLLRQGNDILREQGVISFVNRTFSFLARPFFNYQVFYMYEEVLDNTEATEFTPRTQTVSLRIISTPEDVDELIAEGFDFSHYRDTNQLKKRLNMGAVLFCAFVQRELAHISLVAMSKNSQWDAGLAPFAVDYQSEAYVGATETNPKYRGVGICPYVYSKIYQFLKEKGRSKAKFTTNKGNVAFQRAQDKLGSRVSAEGRLLKILLWKSWKEKPIRGV